MARWLLRAAITASLLLIASHFVYAVTTFPALTLESVQFAELGLPLLFAAFLNGVVWSLEVPPRRARWTAHATSACMLGFAGVVAWLAPVPPAYLVLLCSALLAAAGVMNDRRARSAMPGAAAAAA